MRLLGIIITAIMLASCSPAERHAAQVAITFDVYDTAVTTAFPIMQRCGLVGTYFVDPLWLEREMIDVDELKRMRDAGWSIQAYASQNLVTLLNQSGPEAVSQYLQALRDRMAALGFDVVSLAPAGRAWNAELRDIAEGIFSYVRIIQGGQWQQLPPEDPLWIRWGGTNSLSSADTAQTLGAQLDDVIEHGGLWTIVVHKVGDDADPLYSVEAGEFGAFCDLLASRSDEVSVITFDRALVNAAPTS